MLKVDSCQISTRFVFPFLADSKKVARDKKDLEKSPEAVALKTGENETTEKKKKSKTRKEKSVLQTKLTKLAIQIGYVGKILTPLPRTVGERLFSYHRADLLS